MEGSSLDAQSSSKNLSALFAARNIALVGASDTSRWSALIAERFVEYGHVGKQFAVNRGAKMAHGLPGYASVRDIPEPVDTAYIFVPAQSVEDALRDAAAAGVRNAVILSSGFSEAGEHGAALQRSLVEAAADCGVTMLGPNSLGFANFTGKSFCTSMRSRMPVREGNLALVSQSGAIAVELAKWAHSQGTGLSFLCATGNEAQIGIAEVVDYLVDDPATHAIALYVEGIADPASFMRAASRALAARKPLVVLKIGRSAVSDAVVQAHTGALTGEDKVFDAMCAHYGVTRTNSIEELVSTADCLGRIGPIDPPRVGAASVSGGACSMYADLAALHGLSVPPYSTPTRAALTKVLPDFASDLNPLDVTGAVVSEPQRWRNIIPILEGDPEMGLIVTIFGLPSTRADRKSLDPTFEAIASGYRAANTRPAIMNFSLQECSEEQFALRKQLGLDIVLPSIELGVRALAHLERWSEATARPSPAFEGAPAPAYDGHRPTSERETLNFLDACGIPVIPATLVTKATEAARAADEIGGAIVLKIASPDIAHKTEAGGVRLGLRGADAVKTAFDEIIASARAFAPAARLDGVLVSPMRSPAVELIIGVVRDPQWGPALMVGLGGVFAEVMEDTELTLLPASRERVRAMLSRDRIAKLLKGFRGAPAADIERLIDVIVAIGDAALSLGPQLTTLEINPLRIEGAEIECLDGLAVYADTASA